MLFETAGGLAPKLVNSHKLGGERVKELDFFVASIEVPAVIVRPPDPAVAVAQMALQVKHSCVRSKVTDRKIEQHNRAVVAPCAWEPAGLFLTARHVGEVLWVSPSSIMRRRAPPCAPRPK